MTIFLGKSKFWCEWKPMFFQSCTDYQKVNFDVCEKPMFILELYSYHNFYQKVTLDVKTILAQNESNLGKLVKKKKNTYYKVTTKG